MSEATTIVTNHSAIPTTHEIAGLHTAIARLKTLVEQNGQSAGIDLNSAVSGIDAVNQLLESVALKAALADVSDPSRIPQMAKFHIGQIVQCEAQEDGTYEDAEILAVGSLGIKVRALKPVDRPDKPREPVIGYNQWIVPVDTTANDVDRTAAQAPADSEEGGAA
ncbi:MAG: hypothetical protein AAGB26_08290 [Planctomycetota bacterium]